MLENCRAGAAGGRRSANFKIRIELYSVTLVTRCVLCHKGAAASTPGSKACCMMVHACADLGGLQEDERSFRCELCDKLEKRSLLASDAVPGQR